MGRTVHTGLAVITGTEDRQHGYVALTRGTDANYAYVFTTSPKRADPVPGPRPAPELARYDQIHAERDGVRAPATRPAAPGAALGVLAGVLDRDGQQHSATQTRQQALADADHLAVLHAIWTAETTPARQQRYRDLLAAALPPEHHRGTSHQARWLFRTLRAAELAGLDPAQVLADAIGERDLAGSRDLAAVLGRPDPVPARRRGPAPGRAVVRAGPRHHRPRTPRLRHRDRRPDGRAQGPDRRARRRARPALGSQRAGPGPRAPAGPAGLAAAGRLDRRLAGTVRLPPPGRAHRARARRGRPGPAGRLARGPRRPRSRRRARRPRHARRQAAAPARHLSRSKPPGPPKTSATSSARSAPPPGTPTWPPCAPARKPRPPPAAASTTTPLSSEQLGDSYQALHQAYRHRETVFAAVMADRADWDSGHPRPAPSGRRPPTPNCAAATPASTTRRCARPNPSPPPRPSATSSP